MTSIWWFDVVPDQLVEAQRARHAVDDREHVAAERRLQLGVLVEVVQHDLGDGVAAQRDDQPPADAVAGLVGDLADALEPAVLDRLGDRLGQVVRVDLVGQLGDDQLHPAAGVLLDGDDGAHAHRATAGAVGVLDAVAADDQAVGREVGPLDPLHAGGEGLLGLGLGVVERPEDGRGDLAQVVRGHVGRHADRDAGRAVDQQVRDAARAGPAAPGSCRRSWAGSRRSPRRCPGSISMASGVSRPRCSAWRRAGRCPGSRSCPGRRPAGSASTTAGPAGRGRRRSRESPCGW